MKTCIITSTQKVPVLNIVWKPKSTRAYRHGAQVGRRKGEGTSVSTHAEKVGYEIAQLPLPVPLIKKFPLHEYHGSSQ